MTTRVINAMDVANYVIYLATQQIVGDEGEKEGITNLKLQKILYFIEAYSLSVKEKSIFPDSIKAWEYGPVVPEVYHVLKQHGSRPIFSEDDYVVNLSEEDQKTIKSVWDSFSKYSASRLVDITHRHTPWIAAYDRSNNGESSEINRSEIAEYYRGLFV